MFLRRKRCKCCTPPNCTIATDNFDRADNSSLGADWTEEDGDWEIVSNRLKPPSNGTVVFAHDDPEDPADDGIRWEWTLNFGGATGNFNLNVDYNGPAEFCYAKVTCTGSATATMQLFENTGGSTVELTSPATLNDFNWNEDFTFAVCWGLQFITPACSEGETTWMWVFDDAIDDFTWSLIAATGDCFDGNCTQTYPNFDGTFDGQTTTTNCESVLSGGDGARAFGIAATYNRSQTIAESVQSHGNTGVALWTESVGGNARADDAVLRRTNDSCPGCRADFETELCTGCQEDTAPQFLLVEVEDIVTDCFSHCTRLNRSYVIEYSGAYNDGGGYYCLWGGSITWFNIGAPCINTVGQFVHVAPQVQIYSNHIYLDHFVGNPQFAMGFKFAFEYEITEPLDCSSFNRLELTPRLTGTSPHGPNSPGVEDTFCDYSNMKVYLTSL